MDAATIKRFLRAVNARNVTVSGSWVQAACPLAPWQHKSGRDSHPSFAVKVEPEAESPYNCFSCGGGPDLLTLVQALAAHGATAPRYDLKTAVALAVEDGDRPIRFTVKEWGAEADAEEYVTLPEPWLATFMPAAQSPRAMRYLKSRDVPDSVITFLDLRYDTEKDAVCFPIRDAEGVLCALRGRRLRPKGDAPKYHVYGDAKGRRNTAVWYGEAWLDFDKPVLMVESVFDVASALRVYRNVCAPMTAGFSERRAARLKQAIEVVTVFDADPAGDKARARASQRLPGARVTHLYPPAGHKDVGDMSVADLRELLSGKLRLTKEGR